MFLPHAVIRTDRASHRCGAVGTAHRPSAHPYPAGNSTASSLLSPASSQLSPPPPPKSVALLQAKTEAGRQGHGAQSSREAEAVCVYGTSLTTPWTVTHIVQPQASPVASINSIPSMA